MTADRDLIAEGCALLAAATPGPFVVSDDNSVFAHLQSLHRIEKDGWRERVASNMQSANAAWVAWLLNNGPQVLDIFARVQIVAEEWATQPNDYDDDTEQQIRDGQVILSILGLACAHVSWSGNDADRWLCDECRADMGPKTEGTEHD